MRHLINIIMNYVMNCINAFAIKCLSFIDKHFNAKNVKGFSLNKTFSLPFVSDINIIDLDVIMKKSFC